MGKEQLAPTPGPLEEHSLWYRYKTQVWPEQTEQAITAHNIMRVVRGIHYPTGMAYVSAPITSGKTKYEQFLTNPTLFPHQVMERVINTNYTKSYTFFKEVEQRSDSPIIFPSDFGPIDQTWEQPHFQALWLGIIAEKASVLHMIDEWEYSNGCVEELVHAFQLRLGLPKHNSLAFYNTKGNEQDERERMREIAVLDHRGNEMTPEDGIDLIEEAATWIGDNGFDARRAIENRSLLAWTNEQINLGFYQ